MYEDIPIYEDSSPPPRPAPVQEQPDESDCETRPFIRPEQLVSPRRPRLPKRASDPFVEATEVMRDAPWLQHDEQQPELPPALPRVPATPLAEASSWDDEPTRVEPPSFTDPASQAPPARSPRPKGRPIPKRPLNRDTQIDPPRPGPPARVPRPKPKT